LIEVLYEHNDIRAQFADHALISKKTMADNGVAGDQRIDSSMLLESDHISLADGH